MNEREQKQIFDKWISEHRGILFKIIRAYAFTHHDQEDLFQEITLQLWLSIPNFQGESKPSTWIYRVALYTATVWVRQERKTPQTQPIAPVAHTLIAKDEAESEQVRWLYEQIAALDPIDRSVCLLLLDGFSYKEMANILGISESNVGVKIHRVKQRLLRQAEEEAHEGV